MDSVKDIELDNFDLRIVNGVFMLSESDSTHIEHLLLLDKGNLKHSPITGIGIVKYLNSPNSVNNIASLKSKMKAQLEYDGYTDVKIDTTAGIENIKIDAKRI